jgi:hypothetical protein
MHRFPESFFKKICARQEQMREAALTKFVFSKKINCYREIFAKKDLGKFSRKMKMFGRGRCLV